MIGKIKSLVNNNSYFFLPFIIFILLGAACITLTEQASLHLFFNQYHNTFFNSFFYYVTFVGDGVTATIICIALLMVKYKYALITATSSILASSITQFLKQVVFSDEHRPKKFFEGIADLHLVETVEYYSHNSFPSGHTTVAFALFSCIAFIVSNKHLKLMLFCIALLVGASRIYLSQHFFEDVYAGAIIGCLTSIIVFLFMQNLKPSSILEKNLLTSFKK